MATSFGDWELVIGLEVHAQLLTRTKAFCGCATSFGDRPNTHVCPVCLGLPGALPVLSREAVRMAVSAAIALGCTVQEKSVFARKNYFYPDLPKGYQISQYDLPLALRGSLEVDADLGKRRVGILRVHMEEDAGKNIHGVGDDSIVDLNRAGTALIEIVGDPDLRSAAEAADYLKRLRDILMFIGVNDGNLEQGSFRCDANVSVRPIGAEKLGTRTELKNINSFRFVTEAIEIEARRQIAVLESGGRIRQQTRGYNSEKKETYPLRDKENESGYRYFPDPDLPTLVVDANYVAAIRTSFPPLPAERRARLVESLGLAPNVAAVLTSHPKIAAFFDESSRLYADPIKLGNFLTSEVMRDVRTSGLDAAFPVTPTQLAELLQLVDAGTISGKQAKEVYALLIGATRSPTEIVRERGMAVLSDLGAIEEVVRAVLDLNARQAAAYRSGKTSLLGFFVGQVMKQTGGSAAPAVVNTVLKRLLDAPEGAPPGAQPTPVPFPPTSSAEQPPTLAPRPPATQPAPADKASAPTVAPERKSASKPATQPPIEGSAEDLDPSPMAHSVAPVAPTLTSAAGKMLPIITPQADFPPTSEPEPALPELVPFDDFARIDLRVGLIVSAARVPRKDKLVDLRVDTGDVDGPRRIIAGLALSFIPEALVGQRVIVAVNLEPRAFSKELVSHGVILAAGPSDALALSTVTRDVPPGTKVS
jgi:aspartyl-tRNA(Asn)/glutamyl-tRNA(Gln) amidotransferase subunit B